MYHALTIKPLHLTVLAWIALVLAGAPALSHAQNIDGHAPRLSRSDAQSIRARARQLITFHDELVQTYTYYHREIDGRDPMMRREIDMVSGAARGTLDRVVDCVSTGPCDLALVRIRLDLLRTNLLTLHERLKGALRSTDINGCSSCVNDALEALIGNSASSALERELRDLGVSIPTFHAPRLRLSLDVHGRELAAAPPLVRPAPATPAPAPPELAHPRGLCALYTEARSHLNPADNTIAVPHWGEFLNEVDVAQRGDRRPTQAENERALNNWAAQLEAVGETQREVSTPLEQFHATFQAMGRGVIHRQEDEHASIHDALITRIANCQVRTTLMSAALQAHPAPLPSPLETAIEVFDNHVQFVTHNRRTHEVWDPLSGSKSPPRRRGDLYRQSYLVLSLLRHLKTRLPAGCGADRNLPHDQDFLLFPGEPGDTRLAQQPAADTKMPDAFFDFGPARGMRYDADPPRPGVITELNVPPLASSTPRAGGSAHRAALITGYDERTLQRVEIYRSNYPQLDRFIANPLAPIEGISVISMTYFMDNYLEFCEHGMRTLPNHQSHCRDYAAWQARLAAFSDEDLVLFLNRYHAGRLGPSNETLLSDPDSEFHRRIVRAMPFLTDPAQVTYEIARPFPQGHGNQAATAGLMTTSARHTLSPNVYYRARVIYHDNAEHRRAMLRQFPPPYPATYCGNPADKASLPNYPSLLQDIVAYIQSSAYAGSDSRERALYYCLHPWGIDPTTTPDLARAIRVL